MRTAAIASILLTGLAGCGAAKPHACVPAPIHTGRPPGWTAAAFSDSSPGLRIRYSLSDHSAAAAVWFAPRLRAGHPENPANKVLWVVRYPRDGHPLEVVARRGQRTVRMSFPDDSSPGEIYPSHVDLPTPGCWSLALTWGKHRTNIDLQVVR